MSHEVPTPESNRSIAGMAFAMSLVGYGVLTGLTVRPAAIDVLAAVVAGDAPSGWSGPYALIVSWAHAVLGVLGGSVYGTATALSVIGGALAVAAVGVAAQGFGLARREAVLASALVGTCPAVVSFATQPGSPALGLACAALALAALARWLHEPLTAAGVALAIFCALGVVIDEGNLLLPLALATVWFERCTRTGVPGIALFAVLALLTAAWLSDPCREVITKGWLRAFVLLSALWLVALLRPATRSSAAVLGVALLVGLGAAAMRETEVRIEGGALLCFALPLALLALRAASPTVLRATVVLGLVVGVARVASQDQSGPIGAWAGGLREVVAESGQARLIVRDDRERGFVLAGAEDIECATIEEFVTSFEVAAEREFYTQKIEALLEAGMVDLLRQGYRVYLTQGAEDVLRDVGYRVRHHVAVRVVDHLWAHFSLVQVEAASFRAKQITLPSGK